MTYIYWLYAAFITVGCFVEILSIGKEREPVTPGIAVAVIIIELPLVYLLVRAALAGV